ncbi:MAG TPA: Zn-ribbon domain-containing OB-fold protein [Burkholderiaceae bacterium]|nr:Zn-ribbon domain-containing OB-fold protein [Anaerolineales bacterium]HSG21114.1 Zn-ribbon domain-containing OB-fold protein [Burkholderiaceae bacterium]
MAIQDFNHTSFQAHLAEHKLLGARCQSCGTLYLPPRSLCANCYSQEMAWEALSGEGELVAFTTIYIAPTAMIEAGYGRDNPYCSGVVRLKEGLSISAQILDVDVSDPAQIAIGTPLQVEYLERGEGDARKTYLAFRSVR